MSQAKHSVYIQTVTEHVSQVTAWIRATRRRKFGLNGGLRVACERWVWHEWVARNRAGIPLTDGHLRRVTPVNDETYVINDPLCECGSTITVRRLKAPTPWGKPADSIRACCTDHPREGHPLPEQVRDES